MKRSEELFAQMKQLEDEWHKARLEENEAAIADANAKYGNKWIIQYDHADEPDGGFCLYLVKQVTDIINVGTPHENHVIKGLFYRVEKYQPNQVNIYEENATNAVIHHIHGVLSTDEALCKIGSPISMIRKLLSHAANSSTRETINSFMREPATQKDCVAECQDLVASMESDPLEKLNELEKEIAHE